MRREDSLRKWKGIINFKNIKTLNMLKWIKTKGTRDSQNWPYSFNKAQSGISENEKYNNWNWKLHGLKSRIDLAGERNSPLQSRADKITQKSHLREKKCKRKKSTNSGNPTNKDNETVHVLQWDSHNWWKVFLNNHNRFEVSGNRPKGVEQLKKYLCKKTY